MHTAGICHLFISNCSDGNFSNEATVYKEEIFIHEGTVNGTESEL